MRFSPEVVGAVLVSHDDNSHLGVVLDRVDAVCRIREVLLHVGRQALECRFPASSISNMSWRIVSFLDIQCQSGGRDAHVNSACAPSNT